MRLILAMCVLMLADCKQRDYRWEINPAMVTYVESFYRESKIKGYSIQHFDLIVRFEELRPYENGRCSTEPGTTPLVRISKRAWDSIDTSVREELVYHELGHCLLFRTHNNDVVGNRPVSIMNSILFPGPIYTAYKQAYLDELFSRTSARLAEF